MSRKLFATTVLATLFASTSFAQMSDDPTLSAGDGATPNWDQSINDVFFEDESAGLVRSHDDIQQGWESLSADQQAQIRDDCAAMTADAGGTMGTMDTGDTAMETGTSEFETDMSADAGTDSLDADPLGSDTAAGEPLDQGSDMGSDMAADTGADPLDSDTAAASDPIDQGADTSSDMAAGAGDDALDSDPLASSDTAASATVDTQTTTGSTMDDDAGLQAAAFQQICTTVDSF